MTGGFTDIFKDILNTLCRDVKPLSSSNAQLSFVLSTTQQAQLAYDILAAHGLDVRVYHEDNASKLYINLTTVTPSEEKLTEVLAHADSIHRILETFDSKDLAKYQISFTNTINSGKQLTLLFPSTSTNSSATHSHTPVKPNVKNDQPPVIVSTTPTGWTVKKKSAFLAAGPKVARPAFLAERGVRGWMQNYFASHFAESFLAFCAMIFMAIFVLSIIITAKGYMCPDLAVVKSKAWYCK